MRGVSYSSAATPCRSGIRSRTPMRPAVRPTGSTHFWPNRLTAGTASASASRQPSTRQRTDRMPTFTVATTPAGPLVDAEIGLCADDVRAFRRAGRVIPPPVRVRALLDTGAGETCVDPALLASIRSAGIQPERFVLSNLAPATRAV